MPLWDGTLCTGQRCQLICILKPVGLSARRLTTLQPNCQRAICGRASESFSISHLEPMHGVQHWPVSHLGTARASSFCTSVRRPIVKEKNAFGPPLKAAQTLSYQEGLRRRETWFAFSFATTRWELSRIRLRMCFQSALAASLSGDFVSVG